MLLVLATSVLIVIVCTLLHYETLAALNGWLPRIRLARRRKLLVVIIVATVAHAVEAVIWGVAQYLLVRSGGVGSMSGRTELTLLDYISHSAETYTSLGYGHYTPEGPIRMLAGIEALNGLLLIAWTASFAYLEMERYWKSGKTANGR